MLWYDQLEEMIAEAVDEHISRDPSVEYADRQWEDRNLAKRIAHYLSVNGVRVSSPSERKEPDLSQFEGM